MSDEKQCIWCKHYRVMDTGGAELDYCNLRRPLEPCEQYEREPGADDDES